MSADSLRTGTRPSVELTILNSMAGREVEEAFDRHVAWGLRVLDLKDGLFGKPVEKLSGEEAQRVRELAAARDLRVHTLSTGLFIGDIEQGETAFRETYGPLLDNVLDIAPVLRPEQIRLLMASSSGRAEILDSCAYLEARHAWVFEVYRNAIDRVHEAGFRAVIENEVGDCLFSRPQEITEFFDRLDRTGRVSLIWDVQNLWQMGTYPSLSVWESLRDLVGMVHAKGGRSELPGGPLKWKSHLEDASWPVVPIVRRVVADGRSPVICLNPSHGEAPEGFAADYRRDIEFLREQITEIG